MYIPHVRMTLSGFLGEAAGPEIWSCNIALAKGDDEAPLSQLVNAQPNNAVWDDLVRDAKAWFVRPSSAIGTFARLRSVKFAPIGADGYYTGAPIERDAGNVAGGGNSGYPYQVACAVTFHTPGDFGRLKGRIFQPAPAASINPATGLMPEATADGIRASMDTFLEAIGNQPGADVLDLRAVVASQGRRNKDGTLRIGPANHPITAVSCARTLDTIRRRRNKLADKGLAVPVSF